MTSKSYEVFRRISKQLYAGSESVFDALLFPTHSSHIHAAMNGLDGGAQTDIFPVAANPRYATDLWRPSPLAKGRGQATTFVVNAALVASQWQHRAWTVALHPFINAQHKAGQAASTVLHVFGVTRHWTQSISFCGACWTKHTAGN